MRSLWPSRTLFLILAVTLLLAGARPAAGAGQSEWIFVPFPIHSPETDWALTASVIGTARFGDSLPSSLIGSAAWSQRGQKSVSLDSEVYLEDRWLLQAEMGFEDWPTDYFGSGNQTEAVNRETYTSRDREIEADIRYRLTEHLWVGPALVLRDLEVHEVEAGGLLAINKPPGFDGGQLSGAGAIISYDSRDDVHAPLEGMFAKLGSNFYEDELGSDFIYAEYVLDSRQFFSPGSGLVLALHQYLRHTSGEVPFQELSRLGNSETPARLRGYVTGRFRDNSVAAAQAELRFPGPGSWSGVVFGGAGNVASSPPELADNELKWAPGVGLRYRASESERINLRLDVAYEDGTSLYFDLLEAF